MYFSYFIANAFRCEFFLLLCECASLEVVYYYWFPLFGSSISSLNFSQSVGAEEVFIENNEAIKTHLRGK